MIIVFSTSKVEDGVCYGYVNWDSEIAPLIYGVWYFFSFFGIEVFGLVFCYWRILVVIRRQNKVMAAHSGSQGHGQGHGHGPSATDTRSHHIQMNVIKTMILVCSF